MRRIGRGVLAVAVLLATGGCAAILRGSFQKIPVKSFPAGATVTTNPSIGQFTTPTTLYLARKESYVLSFSHAGYSTASFKIQKRINGLYVLVDVWFGGIILGPLVDGLTGAWYDLSPEAVVTSLTKVGDGPGPASITVRVDAINHGRELRITSDDPGVSVQVANRR